MKNLKFFIILLGIICFPALVFSQSFQRQNPEMPFFMPTQETSPKYEKLPPIRNNNSNIVRNKNTLYEVRYVLVEGVYVPTYTEKRITAQQPIKEELTAENHPSVADTETFLEENNDSDLETLSAENFDFTPETTQTEFEPETQEYHPISIPKYEKPSPSDPAYTKIYDKYIQDTIVFQKDKEFPYNKKLKASLNKMSSDREIVFFKGKAN